MNQTNRLLLQILRRVTTRNEALVLWLCVGALIAVALYYNRRTDA